MKTPARPLAEAIQAYLPPTLVHDWELNPRQPATWGKWIQGSLMHCDITGFTAMSESLAQFGKEGAEMMAAVLNRFFERMLTIAERWGGEQVKFGGDAMLLLFKDGEYTARAGACGLEMQHAMDEFRNVSARERTYRLKMRIGVHSGRFYSASVGNPDLMLHYMLLGPDVSRSAVVEAAARPGHVALSEEAADLVTGQCRLSPAGAGLWRLRDSSARPVDTGPGDRHGSAPPGILARYLLPPIQQSPSLLERGLLAGEHRRVAVMFINLLGLTDLLGADDEHALAELNSYVSRLIVILQPHGGVLVGSDVSDHGDKLIALFGAPVSQEHQESSALACALEIDAGLRASGSALKHRIGINSGFAFAGEIGSRRRREYTVIGDTINLSARLMTAAKPGEIIAAAATASQAGAGFQLARMRPLRVKNISAPVHAFRVRGAADDDQEAATNPSSELIGREREFASLENLARRAAGGRTQWAYVYGEAGIGKSRLTGELAARLRESGWKVLLAGAHAHTAQAPFAPWLPLLRSILGVSGNPAEWEPLRSSVTRLAPQRSGFAPLVADLLSIEHDESSGLASVDVQSKHRMLLDTVVALVSGLAMEQPLLLIIEDTHWADPASLELLAEVRRLADVPLLVCLTSREGPVPGIRPDVIVHLTPLDAEDARHLLAASVAVSPERISAVLARAQGNPLFLREFALAAKDGDLPQSINDVLMARVDRLGADLKYIVRIASVIGPVFEAPLLESLAEPTLKPAAVHRGLAELGRLGFVRQEPERRATMAFSHVITREVVYESMAYSQRRRLHGEVVQQMERESEPQIRGICELLLHHAEGAADVRRVARYAGMSGDRAAAVFANQPAIDYYHRSLQAVSAMKRPATPDQSLLLERIADCRETLGQHRQASETYASALAAWQQHPSRGLRVIEGGRFDAGREAALCRKIGVSLERECDFDAALEWLDRAVRSVPPRRLKLAAQVSAAKCVSLFRKGLHEEGVEWGQKALGFAQRSRDLREVAYARNMLATCFMARGDLRRAVRHLRQAVRFYHELADFPGQASANNNLGMCYFFQGTLDAALYYYQVALHTDERVGDLVDAAIVQSNIGEVLLSLGRIEEAVQNLSAVVRVHQQGGGLAAVAGLSLVNLSRCQLLMGDLDASKRHLRRAKRLLKDVGAEALLLEARLQQSELLLAYGSAAAAAASARRSLARIRALHLQLLESRGERILGEALAAGPRPERAEEHLRASILLARKVGAAHEEARSAIAMARVLLRSGASASRVSTYVRRGEKIARRMGAELELRETDRLWLGIA